MEGRAQEEGIGAIFSFEGEAAPSDSDSEGEGAPSSSDSEGEGVPLDSEGAPSDSDSEDEATMIAYEFEKYTVPGDIELIHETSTNLLALCAQGRRLFASVRYGAIAMCMTAEGMCVVRSDPSLRPEHIRVIEHLSVAYDAASVAEETIEPLLLALSTQFMTQPEMTLAEVNALPESQLHLFPMLHHTAITGAGEADAAGEPHPA